MRKIEIEIPEGKEIKLEGNTITFVDIKKDITEVIKTYEDACEYNGVKPRDFSDETDESTIAYLKIIEIVKALNEGVVVNPCDNIPRYLVYFFKKENGCGCSNTHYAPAATYANVGSRLCFASKDRALYCAKQFWPLWRTWMGYSEDMKLIDRRIWN